MRVMPDYKGFSSSSTWTDMRVTSTSIDLSASGDFTLSIIMLVAYYHGSDAFSDFTRMKPLRVLP